MGAEAVGGPERSGGRRSMLRLEDRVLRHLTGKAIDWMLDRLGREIPAAKEEGGG